MTKFILECEMIAGWEVASFATDENGNREYEIYQTREEAESALAEFLADCRAAIAAGHMQDFDESEWRVNECPTYTIEQGQDREGNTTHVVTVCQAGQVLAESTHYARGFAETWLFNNFPYAEES